MGSRPEVLIIGGGPGGMASLIWAKRLGIDALLLEKEPELGGQLRHIFNRIVDYPGLPVTDGQELKKYFVEHLRPWSQNIRCGVEIRSLDVATKKVVVREGGREDGYEPRFLILAMGARQRRLGVPGEQEMLARGESYSAARDRFQFRGRPVAVVGGGDRALEGALLLAEAGADVLLIHRRRQFTARPEYVQPVLNHRRIRVLTESTVQQIVGQNRLVGIVVRQVNRDPCRGDVTELFYPVDALFVRIGMEPNSHMVRGQLAMDGDGYVLVDGAMETSAENVFAVGDLCTRPLYSSISMATAQGMVAAKTIVSRLAE
jgi:thioredoxin reductase (NADPH)